MRTVATNAKLTKRQREVLEEMAAPGACLNHYRFSHSATVEHYVTVLCKVQHKTWWQMFTAGLIEPFIYGQHDFYRITDAGRKALAEERERFWLAYNEREGRE